jgi:TRAP-type C4-dicarboxylate transport system substrate-binding protein
MVSNYYPIFNLKERRRDKMKSKKVGIVFSITALMALTLMITPLMAGEIVLKATSAWRPSVMVAEYTKFIETVNKRAKGELTIKFLGGPEVVPSRELSQALRKGVVHMGFLAFPYYQSIMPLATAGYYTRLTQPEERESGFYDYFNKLHQEQMNVFYLGKLCEGITYQVYTNVPVHKADLTGLKIRVTKSHEPFMKALGASCVFLPPGEIYTAMQRGVVDGCCWTSLTYSNFGYHEVTKYVIDPPYGQGPGLTLVNLDAWKKIPKHLQVLIMDTYRDRERVSAATVPELMRKEREIQMAAGIKVITLPPEEADKYLRIQYEKGWEALLKKAPEDARKLKGLLESFKK